MKHKFLLIGILPLLLGLAACDNNEEELKKLAAQLDEQAAKIENQDKLINEQNQKLSAQNQQLAQQLEQMLQETQRLAGVVNGYKAVDLGLSVRWATCNVGAQFQEETGYYLQWGAIEEQGYYNYPDVRFWDDENSVWTKYNEEDQKFKLESEDDAATHYWGAGWRMPTAEELDELTNDCIWQYTVVKGVPGAVITGSTGNSIFLPTTGYRVDDEIKSLYTSGYYWSSSLREDRSPVSFCLSVDSSNEIIDEHDTYPDSRYYGQCVRAVCAY